MNQRLQNLHVDEMMLGVVMDFTNEDNVFAGDLLDEHLKGKGLATAQINNLADCEGAGDPGYGGKRMGHHFSGPTPAAQKKSCEGNKDGYRSVGSHFDHDLTPK
jgi:hypothetical protein